MQQKASCARDFWWFDIQRCKMVTQDSKLSCFQHAQMNTLGLWWCVYVLWMLAVISVQFFFAFFNPRWLIISSLRFKGFHFGPLMYPHIPLMGFKRGRLALHNNPPCLRVLPRLHIWLFRKRKINDLLARLKERVCLHATKKESTRDRPRNESVRACTHTALQFRGPLKPRLLFAMPLPVSHVLYLQHFIQMEMRCTSFFPHCRWQGQRQMIQLAWAS